MLRYLAMTCLLAAVACSAPPVVRWSGTSDSSLGSHEVTLEYTRDGDELRGTYTVGVVAGAFEGRLVAQDLAATLRPSEDCVYQLTGTVSDEVLQGTFDPTGCPGGVAGSWTLTRR